MLLINPTFKIENPDIIRDKKGRFLLVWASLRDEEFCFANIYAPNDPSLQKTFFNELSNCNLTQMTISSLLAISTARLKVLIRREEKI